ncbi:MAG: GNAT family N-acetyltransferase [Polyangiaceae bacterium]
MTDIEYRDGHDVDIDQLAAMIEVAGWAARSREVVAQQVAGARWVVSAWSGDCMVGLARAISDGVTNAYVSTVVVAEAFRGRGIATALVQRLVGDRRSIRWILHARPELHALYARAGFVPATDILWIPRAEAPSLPAE